MCNCKNQVINNLSVPSYVKLAVDIWNEVKDIPFEDITDLQFEDMYSIYRMIYPNSKKTPERKDIVSIIFSITQYQIKTKK